MQGLKDDAVFIHCIMNYRVSAFVYHYLSKVVGLGKQAARFPMFNQWQPEPVWNDLLTWSSKEIGLKDNED